jgi:hypothetical protein
MPATLRIVLGALVAVSFVTFAVPVGAGKPDACAQRVIRDWYAGGKVDGVYPLRCYRAAMRALPEDVRQYSDANREIARALAYARRGLRDPGSEAARSQSTSLSSPARAAPAIPSRSEGSKAGATTPAPAPDTPVSFASARGGTDGAGLPVPLVMLLTLAAMLFAAAGAAALESRRRRRTGPPDR